MRPTRSAFPLISTVTLLLTATAHADLPQKAGWPIQLPSGTSGGYVLAPQHDVALVDLDDFPGVEVVASSGDRIFVWSSGGVPLPGWPVTVQGTAQAPPSVGDVDGDGHLEVVQAGRGLQYSDTSHLHVFGRDGAPKPGWPLDYPNLIMNPAALGDLDGDGALDLLVQLGAWPPAGTFVALTGSAAPLGPNWEHPMDSYPLAAPAVGDLDGDGQREVAYLTLGEVTVRRADGALHAGFPLAASAQHEHTGSVVVADLDPSRAGLELAWPEIVASDQGGAARLLAAYADGSLLPGFPVPVAADALEVAPLSIGDVDGDGSLEIVAPANGHGIVVVRATGEILATVPVPAQLMTSVQLVDVDGDGGLELLADNNTGDADGVGYLEGLELDGSSAPGFPLRPQGITMANGASVADLDADGELELVAVSSELTDPPVCWINVWSLPGAQATVQQWTTYGASARRTNCHRCEAPDAPLPVEDDFDDGGCSCRVPPGGDTSPRPWWGALLMVVLALRQRHSGALFFGR